MSGGHAPSAHPVASPVSELADELTALRKKLDATMGDLDTVRAVAAAKVSALHGQLKQVSAGMSALEAAIVSATAARGATSPVNGSTGPAHHAEAEHAEPARHAKVEHVEPAHHTEATEAAEAGGQIPSESPSEHKPTDDAARKEPTTAADVAAAMLADLSLESPPSHAVAEEPPPARPTKGHTEADVLVDYQSAQSAQSTISPSDTAILEQEFGEYLELATVQPPAPGPSDLHDDVQKTVTDAWA
jgi:hypothetical protein